MIFYGIPPLMQLLYPKMKKNQAEYQKSGAKIARRYPPVTERGTKKRT